MTGTFPLLAAPRTSPFGKAPATPRGGLAAIAPLALYLGGGALLRGAALSFSSDTLELRVASALLAGALALLFMALVERRKGRDPMATVGLRGPFAGALTRGVAVYLAALPLLALASAAGVRWFGSPRDPRIVPVFAGPGSPFGGPFLGLLVVLVAVPLVEEILFRGWLQGAAAARVGPGIAVPAVAFLWTVGHDPASRPAILLLGLLLGFLYRRTGRLAACVGVHGLHNALVLFIGLPPPGLFEWTGA
ncbi:MAG TPA: CPBP family intramembrane glutamic endopeptidase [Planctomycetota bacterium]|jgi:membrane protease YdiL (CAAX protease family)|nr:CPBP family intramembrane glutamic endopeptidase [Planctomycetota bacterium]